MHFLSWFVKVVNCHYRLNWYTALIIGSVCDLYAVFCGNPLFLSYFDNLNERWNTSHGKLQNASNSIRQKHTYELFRKRRSSKKLELRSLLNNQLRNRKIIKNPQTSVMTFAGFLKLFTVDITFYFFVWIRVLIY